MYDTAILRYDSITQHLQMECKMTPNLSNNTKYLLALNRIPGIGPKTVQRLLIRWPDLTECFQLSEKALLASGLPAALTQAIIHCDLSCINADLTWLNQSDSHRILTWAHPQYPALLKEIHDPPMVLYAKGDLSCLQQKCLAIVGTRKPTYAGLDIARHFAKELSKHKLTIVSGLALGIDAQAHGGCIDANGQTIAVLGTGIHHIYPHRHRALAEKILENGLIFSEFPLESTANAGHFPRRNRIISGLSLITLVVEAALKSGSLITARLALEQNREVMAIPGAINNPYAQGCHYLLQQGATLVTSVADILRELNITPFTLSEPVKLSLAREAENLVNCLGFDVTTVDQIVTRSGLSFTEVANQLAILEMHHKIKAVPGGYMRCNE